MVPSRAGRVQRWLGIGALLWAARVVYQRNPAPDSPWLLGLGVALTVLMGLVAILGPFEERPWKVALRGGVAGGCLMILLPVETWPLILSGVVCGWTVDLLTLREPLEGDEPLVGGSRWRRGALVLVFAVSAASLFYGIIGLGNLRQTAALFVGLPILLACLVAFGPPSKSLTGSILRAVTMGLVLAWLLWSEGFICILMAAPLFYGIGALIGVAIEQGRKSASKRQGTWTASLLVLTLGPMSLEGVVPGFSFPRQESVEAVRDVPLAPAEVAERLGRAPRFADPLPAFLRLGFPRPLAAQGRGLQPGDERTVVFADGDALRMEVAESREGYVRFQARRDSTMVAHWLSWKGSEVRWQPLPGGGCRVAWTLHYRRNLDPAWYFAPWERYAVRQAGEVLLDASLAAPERAR